jgi:hypothetical protein
MYEKYVLGKMEDAVMSEAKRWMEHDKKDGTYTEGTTIEQYYDDAVRETYYEFPEEFCPVCMLERLTPHLEAEYLRYKCDMLPGQIQKEMKEKFGTLDNWRKRSPIK